MDYDFPLFSYAIFPHRCLFGKAPRTTLIRSRTWHMLPYHPLRMTPLFHTQAVQKRGDRTGLSEPPSSSFNLANKVIKGAFGVWLALTAYYYRSALSQPLYPDPPFWTPFLNPPKVPSPRTPFKPHHQSSPTSRPRASLCMQSTEGPHQVSRSQN